VLHTILDVAMVLGLLTLTFLLGHALHLQKPLPEEKPQHLPAAVPEPQAQSWTLHLHDRYGKLRHEVSTSLHSAPDTWSYAGRIYEKTGVNKDGAVVYQELGA
jgi:hypothetical protein